jgi:hypothetical protein
VLEGFCHHRLRCWGVQCHFFASLYTLADRPTASLGGRKVQGEHDLSNDKTQRYDPTVYQRPVAH